MVKNNAPAHVRQDQSGIVDEVVMTQDHVVVTRNGEPAAALLATADREALKETLEILADAELASALQRSLRSTKRYTLTQVRDRLSKRSPPDRCEVAFTWLPRLGHATSRAMTPREPLIIRGFASLVVSGRAW